MGVGRTGRQARIRVSAQLDADSERSVSKKASSRKCMVFSLYVRLFHLPVILDLYAPDFWTICSLLHSLSPGLVTLYQVTKIEVSHC